MYFMMKRSLGCKIVTLFYLFHGEKNTKHSNAISAVVCVGAENVCLFYLKMESQNFLDLVLGKPES